LQATPSTNPPRLLVVNADDLGISELTNRAIREAHQRGILTSASLMAGGPAFDDAVKNVVQTCPRLGIGLHVNLTSGRCLSPPRSINLLVDSDGQFRHGFLGLWRLLLRRGDEAAQQMALEVHNQLRRVEAAGVRIDHVNSHCHVHMIPGVFRAVQQAAAEANCRIRISDEPVALTRMLRRGGLGRAFFNSPKKAILWGLARRARKQPDGKGLPTQTFGILSSGAVLLPAFQLLGAFERVRCAEVITHPGGADPVLSPELNRDDRRFHSSPNRLREFETLVSEEARQVVRISGFQLVRFCDLSPTSEHTDAGSCRASGRLRELERESIPKGTSNVSSH
jgi:predicted glycoside hydrolase/deacetylase ChbG (UPF0249 family)